MPGNVQTRICAITAQHSLVPTCYSRTAIGRLCSLLSPKGAIRVFHVPLAKVRRVRCLRSTGRRVGHESEIGKRCSHLRCHFGSSVIATCACFDLRSLLQIQMFSPYQLEGSQARSPAPSPRGTVHAPFGAHGSSSTKASINQSLTRELGMLPERPSRYTLAAGIHVFRQCWGRTRP